MSSDLGAGPWGPIDVADVRLRELLAAADQPSFAAVYDLTGARIYASLLRSDPDVDSAATVMTSVYVSAWRHCHTVSSSEVPVMSWLLLTALQHAAALQDTAAHNTALGDIAV
jgi:hypothetical protein